MHTDRARARPLRSLGLTAVLVLALAACGGGGSPEQDPAAGETSSASGSSSTPAGESASSSAATGTPGPTPTPGGTTLRLGSTATVAYAPQAGDEAVLDVTVTRFFSTTFRRSFDGWNISRQQRSAQPYFVEGEVTNAGRTDLGRRPVPLLAVGAGNVPIEPIPFAARFAPCRPGRFPRVFGPGDTMTFCLVYFVPEAGTLNGVAFQPTDDVGAITWTGQVRPLPKGR